MANSLKDELNNLPRFFKKNAKTIMLRMIATMHRQLESDFTTPNVSYLTLLLKVSQVELATEFEKCLHIAVDKTLLPVDRISNGLSLELEMAEGGSGVAAMRECEIAFNKLQEKGRTIGFSSLDRFSAKTILECVETAMEKARISQTDVQKLLPFVKHSLNLEMLAVYERLNEL